MRRFLAAWLWAAFHPKSPPLVSALATVAMMAAVVLALTVVAVMFAVIETFIVG